MTVPPTTRAGALEAVMAEVNAEKAASLGRVGGNVEKALAALQAARPEDRPPLLAAAREAVWSLFVQREAIGQFDHKAVVAHYGIPAEVMKGLGRR